MARKRKSRITSDNTFDGLRRFIGRVAEARRTRSSDQVQQVLGALEWLSRHLSTLHVDTERLLVQLLRPILIEPRRGLPPQRHDHLVGLINEDWEGMSPADMADLRFVSKPVRHLAHCEGRRIAVALHILDGLHQVESMKVPDSSFYEAAAAMTMHLLVGTSPQF